MDCKNLLKFAKAYDNYKYPYVLYKDLVVDGKTNIRRFELMGAWKTGSIRIVKNGCEYCDSLGNQYGFTNILSAVTDAENLLVIMPEFTRKIRHG